MYFPCLLWILSGALGERKTMLCINSSSGCVCYYCVMAVGGCSICYLNTSISLKQQQHISYINRPWFFLIPPGHVCRTGGFLGHTVCFYSHMVRILSLFRICVYKWSHSDIKRNHFFARVYPWLRALCFTSLSVFLLGFVLWNIDNILCDSLRYAYWYLFKRVTVLTG